MYYDLHAYRRVVEPFVRMGVNDQVQMDHSGFYALEDCPQKSAGPSEPQRVLLGTGQSSLALRFFTGRREGSARGSISIENDLVGTFEFEPGVWFEKNSPYLMLSPAKSKSVLRSIKLGRLTGICEAKIRAS